MYIMQMKSHITRGVVTKRAVVYGHLQGLYTVRSSCVNNAAQYLQAGVTRRPTQFLQALLTARRVSDAVGQERGGR